MDNNYLNCFCDSLQRSQWKFMSMDVVLRGMMVLLVTPTYAELSHWMGVLGCGHPILLRDWRSGAIYLTMMKRPASSD